MENIVIGIYFHEDYDGKRIYDEDSMREEFEAKLKEVLK